MRSKSLHDLVWNMRERQRDEDDSVRSRRETQIERAGLHYTSRRGTDKNKAHPVIKQRQTWKEVLNYCMASAAQRSEAVLCRVPFVYDTHVPFTNF